uniref:Uncharacterized protein n=1 Tax=Nelumbo nucifera TaxID=4432 RepID=A0A822ZU74_NELNU|nr:TPA_asm: hypothetical protein HUJ06_018364 [Nelumbo nucifera]
MNPSPMTRRLMDNPETSPSSNGISVLEKLDEKTTQLMPSKRTILQQLQGSADLHSQATTYARLAESRALKAKMKVGSLKDNRNLEELNDEAFTVLPVSAESTRLLPDRKEPNINIVQHE